MVWTRPWEKDDSCFRDFQKIMYNRHSRRARYLSSMRVVSSSINWIDSNPLGPFSPKLTKKRSRHENPCFLSDSPTDGSRAIVRYGTYPSPSLVSCAFSNLWRREKARLCARTVHPWSKSRPIWLRRKGTLLYGSENTWQKAPLLLLWTSPCTRT